MKKTLSRLCTISNTDLCSPDRTTAGAWAPGASGVSGAACSLGDSGESSWACVAEMECGRYPELDGPPGRRVRHGVLNTSIQTDVPSDGVWKPIVLRLLDR